MGRKIARFFSGLLVFILILAIALIVAVTYTFSKEGETPSLFGYSIYIMDGEGMIDIPDESAVISKVGALPLDPNGTVALCKVENGQHTTIMRVVDNFKDDDGNLYYLVRFDLSMENTAQVISADDVIGQALYVSEGLGAFILFATSSRGILILIIVPCVLLIVLQFIRMLMRKSKDERYFDDDENEDDSADNENEDVDGEEAVEASLVVDTPTDEVSNEDQNEPIIEENKENKLSRKERKLLKKQLKDQEANVQEDKSEEITSEESGYDEKPKEKKPSRKEKRLLKKALSEEKARLEREEAERIAREEKARLEREEAERLEREEKARLEREEAERIAREEKARLEREEVERLAREEKARLEREEAERIAREKQIAEEKKSTPTASPTQPKPSLKKKKTSNQTLEELIRLLNDK